MSTIFQFKKIKSHNKLFKLRQCKSSYTVDEIYAIRIQIMLNKGDNMVQL